MIANATRALLHAGLVEELRLVVAPTRPVMGNGRPATTCGGWV